ncbi:MAG: hypothetical protein ACI8R9_002611 [Paraglaciecola sp.]|jgi:hypothetical protein
MMPCTQHPWIKQRRSITPHQGKLTATYDDCLYNLIMK